MKKYESKITKERLNSSEKIKTVEFIEDTNRELYHKLNQQGKSAVHKFIDTARTYLSEVNEPDRYEERVSNVIADVKESKRLYFDEFVIINDYIQLEEKYRNRKSSEIDIDDEFILL